MFYSYGLSVVMWIIILRSLLFLTTGCWPFKKRLSYKYFIWGGKSLSYIGWQRKLPCLNPSHTVWLSSCVYVAETFKVSWMITIRQCGLAFSPGLFTRVGRVWVMKLKLSLNFNVRNKINWTLEILRKYLSQPGTKYLRIFRADLIERWIMF